MQERGLQAIQPETYAPKTSDSRADKPSPNLLLGEPIPEKPNQVWALANHMRPEIFESSDSNDHHHRKHSSLGYRTPAQF